MSQMEITVLMTVALVCVIAAATDICKFKVHNALTLPALCSGVLVSFWHGGLHGLAMSVLGAIVGLSLLLPFFLVRGVGGGDVKLLAAIGAWLGPIHGVEVGVAAARRWNLRRRHSRDL